MRFSSNQLRFLQETLAPPVPELEAPPELQKTQTVSLATAHQPIPFLNAPKPAPDSKLVLPLFCVLVLYCLGSSLLLLSVFSSPELSRQGLSVSSAMLTPAVIAHAFACQHSAGAQALGLVLALTITPVFALTSPSRPEALTALACSLSLFFSLSCANAGGRLRLVVLLFGISCSVCAVAGCLSGKDGRFVLWTATSVTALGQAAATSGVLAQFELVCVVRSK